MVGVEVIDGPDLVHPVAIQVERKDRAEPHPWYHAWPHVALPQHLTFLCHQDHLERVRGKEKHLHVWVVVKVGTVHAQECLGHVWAQFDRHGAELPDR